MADYTYEKLNEQIKTDESLMEEYGKYSDTVSKDVYSQAKNRLAENQPLLDEYATAYKEKQQQTYKQNVEAFDKQFNEKIEKLQKQNDMHAKDIQYIDGMVLPSEWSDEQTQQWRDDYRQLNEDKISDNNLQIAKMKSMVDEKTYIDEEGVSRYKGDNVEVVDLTAPDVDPEHFKMFISEQGAETERKLGTITRLSRGDDNHSVKDDLRPNAKYLYSTENLYGASSPDAGYMTYKFDNALEESTQDALNNSKVSAPKAADTKLDNNAAATVNDDFDVFADANIDSRNLQASYDDTAISKYIEDLNDDAAINHIFSNTFYRIPAVPHWAYSVDFIPTTELLNSLKTIDVYTLSKFLTKSVISLTLPAREMTSTVSNYKGLSVELPARAKTSGELSFTFAETESFIISEILEQLLKYARNDMFYEFDSTIITHYLANTQNTDIKQYADNIDMMNSAIAAYRKFIENYAHEFNILVKLYRAADAKALGDTKKNEYPTFVYFFKGCDVASVKQFKLDYNSDKPIDIGASFMYQYFEEMTYEEYLLRYGGWNDGLDDPLYEASQEEMIAAAEASNPLTLVTHRDVYNVNLERS
ncbi:MAG: hypothetical protein GX663_10880 [Clostridiales bacterium]|nr:hypothetical protein [Clostridiales bacterium]